MEAGANSDVLKKILEDLRSSNLKIGLKFKKLNEFIKEARSLNFDQIINLVNPVDFFSRRLCIDIACALKNFDYILHLLKTAESSVLRKALRKNAWLYRKDSTLTDPDFLLNELFPVISFSSRQIILTKLPHHLNDEERCTSIFEAVGVKYGYENTGDLIVGCNPAYILKVVQEKQLNLLNRHLKFLLIKSPKLVEEYLTQFYKSKPLKYYSTYSNVLQIIAYSHPGILMSILEVASSDKDEYEHWLKLKPKEANRLLRFGKDKILANPAKYVKLINIYGAYKQISKDEYMLLFASVWPATIQEFQRLDPYYYGLDNLICAWLQPFSSTREKGDVIQKVFWIKYGTSMLSYPKFCGKESVKINLPADIRTQIVEAEILTLETNKHSNYSGYFYNSSLLGAVVYKSIDMSIPEIKEFCQKNEVHKSTLISNLIHTCAINEDKIALAEVCKYLTIKYSSDEVDMLNSILREIIQKFNLFEFRAETWSTLFETFQLLIGTENMDNISTLIIHLYIFQTLHPEDAATIKCNEMFMRLLKLNASGSQRRQYYSWISNDVIRRTKLSLKPIYEIVMKELGIAYPKHIMPGSAEYINVEDVIYGLLACLNDWNKKLCRKSQDRLSVTDFPWMVEKVNEILDPGAQVTYYYREHIISYLRSDPVLKRDKAAQRKFMKLSPSPPVFMEFLRKDPQALVEYWETIESCFFQFNPKLEPLPCLELIKYHGYTELSTNLIRKFELILQEATNFGETDLRPRAVTMLSVFLDSSKFLDTVKQWFPGNKAKVVDIGRSNEADGLDMLVRSRIVSSLKNLEFPSNGLPTLMKFCSGDYLKFSLGTLYSLSCKAGYANVLKMLRKLQRRPISVRKHAIRLLCRMSTQQDVHDLLKSLSDAEGSDSIRALLLSYIFQNVATSWQILKYLIPTIDIKEVDSLEELTNQVNIEKIPTHVLEEYFTILWNLFDTFDNQGQAIHLPKLLIAILEMKASLSAEYKKAIIQKHFFSSQTSISIQHQICNFFAQYMLETVSTNMAENLEILQTGLRRIYSPNRDTLKIQNEILTIARRNIFLRDFIRALNITALEIGCTSQDEIKYRKDLFEGLIILPELKHADNFDEYLALQFLVILQTPGRAPDQLNIEIGKEMMTLLDTYIENHGKEIFPLFKDILVAFLSKSNVPRVDLITGILVSNSINWVERTIIALELLPRSLTIDDLSQSQAKYREILENICNSTNPLIQAHAYNWINKIYIRS